MITESSPEQEQVKYECQKGMQILSLILSVNENDPFRKTELVREYNNYRYYEI